jgi:hypothetical protein
MEQREGRAIGVFIVRALLGIPSYSGQDHHTPEEAKVLQAQIGRLRRATSDRVKESVRVPYLQEPVPTE